jgi:hypothetical protein
MKRIVTLVTSFLLSLPGVALAQSRPAPVGSLSANYVYMYNTDQFGHNRSLMGWSAVPEVNVLKHIGIQGDFGELYMMGITPNQSRLVMAAGPRFTFAPRSRFTPFVYGEAGEMRFNTHFGQTYWLPIAKGGIGLEHRVSDSFAVTLVPGEYFGTYQDDGSWNNSFEARVGFTFNLLSGKSYLW